MSEVYHHGIKGQKWGVRRYQNKDGSLTSAGERRYSSDNNRRVVLKKGSDVYRTTNTKEKHKGHAYVTINKKDAKNYEEWGDVHATYKALEDIVVPTRSVQVREAVNLIKNDDEVRMAVAKASLGLTNRTYKKLADMSLDKIGKRPYNTFISMVDENKTVRDKYMKRLADKGYNAVIDEMDRGFMADMPIIIFDRAQTLSKATYDSDKKK